MPDVVGLTIQQRTVRGVEAKISRSGRCTVLRTAEMTLDPAAFSEGRLVDGPAFSTCVRALWAQGGFRSKRVQLVIDGRLAVVRRTELPSLGEAQLRKAASFDIAELLSYPIGEAVFDVDEIEQFERDGTTWSKALVVAVQESNLLALGAAIEDAGLSLLGTDLAAEALARGVAPSDSVDETDDPVAILDCEDATTNIVIRDRSGILFARTLGAGVGENSISVADELESALAQLSEDSSDAGNDAPPTGAGVSTVVESIRRTLSYYNAELDLRPIQRVIVAGARGGASGLVSTLRDTLGVPVETAVSMADWPAGPPLDGYETPIGAAIGVVESKTRHLALTSDRDRLARSARRNRAAALAGGVPVVALLVVAGLGQRAEVTAAQDAAEQSQVATDLLAMRRSELENTTLRIEEWQAAVDRVQGIESQRMRLGLVVRQLADSMPADTRILSIDLQRGTAGELPPGYDGSTPAGVITITGVADDIDGVSRWLAGADSNETIDGMWLVQSTFGPIGVDGESGALFSARGVITEAARLDTSIIDPTIFDDAPASEEPTP